MTKDLAILVGPEQAWMTTEQFFEAIVKNLEAAMASRDATGERTRSRLTPRPMNRPGMRRSIGKPVEQPDDAAALCGSARRG